MSAVQAEKTEAISFVTKKVLVSFAYNVTLMLGDTAIQTHAAICEYQESVDEDRRYSDIPREFTIVALPDGRKLTKSQHLRVGYMGSVVSMVDMD